MPVSSGLALLAQAAAERKARSTFMLCLLSSGHDPAYPRARERPREEDRVRDELGAAEEEVEGHGGRLRRRHSLNKSLAD